MQALARRNNIIHEKNLDKKYMYSKYYWEAKKLNSRLQLFNNILFSFHFVMFWNFLLRNEI